MEKKYKIAIAILSLLVLFGIIGAVVAFTHKTTPVVVPVDTGSVEYLFSGYVTETTGNVILPTTGSVTVTFEAQPTTLPGNYQDNGTFLRAWAEKNTQSLDIPAEAKDVTITFKLAKLSKYAQVPGNIQLSVDGNNLCNWRLTVSNGYTFPLTRIVTQDKPNGFDASIAIGKTLTIKAWIGESRNYLESVTVDYSL